jgi:hypothetical protein
VRVPPRLTVAVTFCSLAIAGCQGSAPQPDASPTAPSRGTARFTLLNGSYSIAVGAGPVTQHEAVLATSNRMPSAYSVLAEPGGAYSLRFSGSGGGARSWTVRLNRRPAWALVVEGGTTHLVMNLSDLRVESLVIAGGAYTMVVDLPPARAKVPVEVTGGANRMTFVIARGSSATLLAGPGVSRVQGGSPEGPRRYVVKSGPADAGYRIRVTSGASLVVLSSS